MVLPTSRRRRCCALPSSFARKHILAASACTAADQAVAGDAHARRGRAARRPVWPSSPPSPVAAALSSAIAMACHRAAAAALSLALTTHAMDSGEQQNVSLQSKYSAAKLDIRVGRHNNRKYAALQE